MKILFFGDIVGKIARLALAKAVPQYQKKYNPDIIIANAENAAHGSGVTDKIIDELQSYGIDFFTSGNHVFKKGAPEVFNARPAKIIRPDNFIGDSPGLGYETVTVGKNKLLIINLIGRIFLDDEYEDPFQRIDKILDQTKKEKPDVIFIDFHAEATSEKVAFSRYVDGRVSAVVGTHTHVPTSDAMVFEKGTAHVSDVGMVGAKQSVIGVTFNSAYNVFLKDSNFLAEIPESGPVNVGAVLIDIDEKGGQARSIERADSEIEV